MTSHLEAWETYAEARLEMELAKDAHTDASSRFRKTEAELVEALNEAELKGIPLQNGVYPHINPQFGFACNKDNVDQVEEWLTETVGDAEPYKKTSLSKEAISEYIKDRIEKGTPRESFPEFLNVRTHYGIKVNAWAKKKAELIG